MSGAVVAATIVAATTLYTSEQQRKEAKKTRAAQAAAAAEAKKESQRQEQVAQERDKAIRQQYDESATAAEAQTVEYGANKPTRAKKQDSSDLIIPRTTTTGTGGSTRTGLGF
jgi:uncharacterized protein HemX